jgi:hypothetical protein
MNGLKVKQKKDGDSVTLQFTGQIDENVSFHEVDLDAVEEVTIDMGGISYINSSGGREWLKWIKSIPTDSHLNFVHCNSIFLDYANMIEGFIPENSQILSFKVPYYCEKCETVTLKSYDSTDIGDVKSDIAPAVNCTKCNNKALLDVITPNFFKFLKK